MRGVDRWGNSGKFDVIVPYSHLSGTALVAGQPRERVISGLGDPRVRLSVNFYGAPALTLSEYPAYQQDLVIGASVQVAPPWGQYDASKAVNLGTRWSIKPDVGFLKAFGPLTIDLTAAVTLFSRNDDYFGGQTLDQAPLYSAQTNLSYDFGRGIWAALGVTYYRGGRTTVNDVTKEDALSNSRVGLTVAVRSIATTRSSSMPAAASAPAPAPAPTSTASASSCNTAGGRVSSADARRDRQLSRRPARPARSGRARAQRARRRR